MFNIAKAPSSCRQTPSECIAFWWMHDVLVPRNHDMFAVSGGACEEVDSAASPRGESEVHGVDLEKDQRN